AFVNVQGPPRVLVVEGQPGNGHNIIAALQATKINVVVGTPSDVPTTLDALAPYSSVVLADVPAVALGTARMQALQAFVRDLGHGLVVSGGQNSYGIGGYADTPLEQTLPMRMDIPQHKDTPTIAVVLIIESLESEMPINISKEAAKGVVNLLSPRDQVGISQASGTLTIPMQHVTNKAAIDKAIDAMNPDDPPSYNPDLINAEQVLLHTDAKIKHVILLGDGDATDNYTPQVLKMAKENITISTVATNADTIEDLTLMQQIAVVGKGRFYRADNPSAIPQVLLTETERAAKRSVINETFVPAVVGTHPILTGLQGLPSLDGYIATTPKPEAQMVLVSHLDDPVLAVWQYGLGRVAAWTSDALGLWTARWLQWNQAAQWWANLVTWTLPTPDSSMNINGKVVNGTAQISVDLPPGTPTQGQQQAQVHIIAPDLSQGTVNLQQTAPAHWEGGFSASQVGAYLLQVTWKGPALNGQQTSQLNATTGMVVPYSPEFRSTGTDLRFLQLLARAGGGTLLNPNDSTAAFTQTLLPVSAAIPITFLLLALAALLLPVDIAARRLSSLEFLVTGWRWLLAHIGIRRSPAATQTAQLAHQPVIAPLGSIRAKRQERQSRTPQIKLPTNQARRQPAARETQAPPQQETPPDTPSVSTTEALLAAKRQRRQTPK
ncbi:MAG TPA: glutamine amidotransferase, partial [Ktedonobacteraceae bacterium]|nr:glutamine amidotransferase [Ktedonobacteraceae bacterium]